jgi:hypothetical protein
MFGQGRHSPACQRARARARRPAGLDITKIAVLLASVLCGRVTAVSAPEKQALVDLHGSTLAWRSLPLWNFETDPCDPAPWTGVICAGSPLAVMYVDESLALASFAKHHDSDVMTRVRPSFGFLTLNSAAS